MRTGDRAPDFTLFNEQKRPVNLYSELDKGPVVLLFYPAAFTGVCTNELHMVSNDLDSYKPARVFGISTDTLFVQAEFSKVNAFKVSLLSDHDASVAAAYNAKFNGDFGPMKYDRIAKRAAFVIDRDGTVVYDEVLANPGNLPDLEAIQNVLADLK
ncbi:MAG: redoxin domain-containing protein [Bacteroidota bacterium]|nr:redoxin domain-containing protein [Bacteroidota bacterium]